MIEMTEGFWAILGIVIGSSFTGIFNFLSQNRQFAHTKEMFLLQNKSGEQVKGILNEMLNHRGYTDRSFSSIKNAVGGFSDDEIRQFLHEVGAKKTSRDNGSKEWWYLKSREEERIKKMREMEHVT